MARRKAVLRKDFDKLRTGSERLSTLNRSLSLTLDRLVGATVRLYRHNRRLEEAERSIRERGSALVQAAVRSAGGR